MRACIIGAGAAGLCSARHVAALQNWKPVVYEQSNNVGGVWVYDEGETARENGQGWHSSMYQNLRTNLPKEVMAFPDFPFPAELPSFIGHADVKRYLEAYADHFDLLQYIKFKHEVVSVSRRRDAGSNRWLIRIKNAATKEVIEEQFDAVFVCNGHHSKPYIPTINGSAQFQGIKMHSTDYRVPDCFSKIRIACFGAGPSGIDIAIDLSSYADKVYLCHKGPQIECPLPVNVIQLPAISQFTENSIIVGEASTAQDVEVDAVVYCTGYEFYFPFLLRDSAGLTLDSWRISPLYRLVVNIEEPSMFFIGLCLTVLPFPVFDTQVEFACSILSGKAKPPSREEMLAWEREDYKHRKEVLLFSHKKSHFLGPLQWEYLQKLAKAGRFKFRVLPVVAKMYEHTRKCRNSDLLGYHSLSYEIVNEEEFVATKVNSENGTVQI